MLADTPCLNLVLQGKTSLMLGWILDSGEAGDFNMLGYYQKLSYKAAE